MTIIRYLQLCWLMLMVLLFHKIPPRKPRGDMRNFARSFYISYHVMKELSRLTHA